MIYVRVTYTIKCKADSGQSLDDIQAPFAPYFPAADIAVAVGNEDGTGRVRFHLDKAVVVSVVNVYFAARWDVLECD